MIRRLARTIETRWSAIPGNARGALWILGSSLAFSAMAVCMKKLGQTLGVWEMITLRTVVALIFISPLLLRAGPRVLVTRRLPTHFLRSCLGMGGMAGFYFAVTHLELTLATTLGFTRILFMILLALLFLGERIRWRRSVATAVGFAGVLICVQPGAGPFNPWTVAGLAGALFAAGVSTTVKRLTDTEPPLTIMVWTYIFMGSMAAVPALFAWRAPSHEEILLVVLLGIFSALGQSGMVFGLRAGEATAITPFEYSRLLYAAALGFVLFGEVPAASTWLGGTVIIVSTLYIAVRESRLRRQRSLARANVDSKPDER